MKREEELQIRDDSDPNKVMLTNGSYLLWDFQDGFYRVAFYERRTYKCSDLEIGIAETMKRPLHNSQVKKIFKYVSGTDEYAAIGP